MIVVNYDYYYCYYEDVIDSLIQLSILLHTITDTLTLTTITSVTTTSGTATSGI